MNFLFLAPRFHSNQADLVRTLSGHGHRVEFLVLTESKSEDHSVVSPIRIPQSSLSKWHLSKINTSGNVTKLTRWFIPKIWSYYRTIAKTKPDVTVIRGLLNPYLLLSLPCLWFLGSRVVLYTQGAKYRKTVPFRLKLMYFFVFKILRWQWFTTVIAPYGHSLDSLHTHERVKFIPFFKSIDPRALEREYACSGPLRILAIGKFEPRKNCLLFLEVIRRLSQKYQVSATWIGECTKKRHREVRDQATEFINQHQLQNIVELKSNLEFSAMAQQYLLHDVFILPSRNEPASVAQVEAMSFGLPVVCSSDNGTAADYVEHGVNGFVVPPTADEFEKALESYLSNRSLAGVHGKASTEALLGRLSVERNYEFLMELVA